jgi:hypothetical protein
VSALIRPLAARRPGVLAFIDLVQDIDVMAPVLEAVRAQGAIRLKIVVSRWLMHESPRTAALLDARGFRFAQIPRRRIVAGRAPSLFGMDAVISAAESSHPAHAAGHALALRAKAAGLAAYTIQHGFENVGLFGLEAGAAQLASDVVFCWFPDGATPRELPGDLLPRLAHVGRPAPQAIIEAAAEYDVGVFENLHWDRYGEEDRRRFVEGLAAAARALPDRKFLLRSHPAGGWADKLGHELARIDNITRVTAAEGRSRRQSGVELLRGVRLVITTPSTVALDAASSGKPVALATDGGRAYDPLPVLRGPHDWIAFAAGEGIDLRTLDQFRSRVLVAGDGAPRIAARLSRDLMSSGHGHG